MPATMSKPLYSIQIVRALAATLVVISHIGRSLLLKAGIDITDVTVLGSAGVDLFFVVSGFIRVHTTTTGRFDARQFMRQRVTRIAPLYWLTTLLHAVSALILPGLSISTNSIFIIFLPHSSFFRHLAPRAISFPHSNKVGHLSTRCSFMRCSPSHRKLPLLAA